MFHGNARVMTMSRTSPPLARIFGPLFRRLAALVGGSSKRIDLGLPDEDGDVVVLAHGKERKVLAVNTMDEVIASTPNASNGVLFVTTRTKLYAIHAR